MKMLNWPLLAAMAASFAAAVPPARPPTRRVDFDREVRPILARCQPCHAEGGAVYGQYPFDRPATVYLLGERLFTRIKDERERAVIRAFLAQAH